MSLHLKNLIKERLKEVECEQRCLHCEAYLKFSLSIKEEDEKYWSWEKERILKGFWSTVNEATNEARLASNVFDKPESLKRGMAILINMETGESFIDPRIWFYSLAERRDKESKKKLKHFWVRSGGCSMSWTTPICCEIANATSEEEALEWENKHFDPIKREFRG